jgi:hypothetical protein
MQVTRTRRLVLALLGLWLPFAYATHGAVSRCMAAEGMAHVAEMPGNAHHTGGSDQQSPDQGPSCPCSCLGACHLAVLASPPASNLSIRLAGPIAREASGSCLVSVRASADRLLPFATAPPPFLSL